MRWTSTSVGTAEVGTAKVKGGPEDVYYRIEFVKGKRETGSRYADKYRILIFKEH